VECYRLDKASFQGLLLARPQIAEEVARIVGSRKSDLDQARDAYGSGLPVQEERRTDLLGRIRRFFGLRG
jgi:hypothetical protein